VPRRRKIIPACAGLHGYAGNFNGVGVEMIAEIVEVLDVGIVGERRADVAAPDFVAPDVVQRLLLRAVSLTCQGKNWLKVWPAKPVPASKSSRPRAAPGTLQSDRSSSPNSSIHRSN